MSNASEPKLPHTAVALYVVHHPQCQEAKKLAGQLYEWFRLGYQTGDTGSASVPFWIRCQLQSTKAKAENKEDEEVEYELNPPIKFAEAAVNIVILLSNHEMVLDPQWRKALLNLQAEVANNHQAAAVGHRIELLPAVLDDSFYNLTPIYENHNPLRLTEPNDEKWRTAVLRRGVLEMTARTLRARLQQHKSNELPEMRVFLSHAKKDGREIAERLRDAIRHFGQLIPWYDANDLAISQGWANTLDNAMNSTTAGMVAVVTDAYPTRPWCRKELQKARTPWDITGQSGTETTSVPIGSKVFAVQPVVAVMKLTDDWTRGLATLEGVPRVGWSDTQPQTSIEGIVDRLVLEMMLHQVRRTTALKMADQARDPRTWFLTWVPDGWTLAQLAKPPLAQAPAGTRTATDSSSAPPVPPTTIVYPGVELSPAERDDLDIQLRLFGPDTRLLSYQEWEEMRLRPAVSPNATPADQSANPQSLLIALSAGGDPAELSRHGLRVEHIDEAMVRIVMRVLSAGHRVAFGGTFNNPEHELTRKIIDTTLRWSNLKGQQGTSDKSANYLNRPCRWPVINYSAYPHYNDLTPEQEAKWIGFCRIERVDPPQGLAKEDRSLKTDCLERRRDLAKLNADALSHMRDVSTEKSALRIVWGGRIEKAKGWMSGILEEVGYSLKREKPILILGALGGCARLIADFLRISDSSWPIDLSLEKCADSSRDAWLTADERSEHDARFGRFVDLLRDYRNQLHSGQPTIMGVSTDLLRSALNPELNTTRLLSHVEQFIEQVAQSQPKEPQSQQP